MGCKAAVTTHNINNPFGPGTADEHTVQRWFKKFCKGDERLEDEEKSGQLLEVDNNQLRTSSKLILLWLHEKLLKNSSSSILRSFGIWSKLVSSVSGCLMSWPKEKKVILKCCLLLFYATTMNHFSIELWCAMKTGLYLADSDNQLSGWTKKRLQITSQSQNCTKKMLWSLFGGLLHPSFLNPRETIVSEIYAQQIDEMHWKVQCLQPASVNRKGPILLHDKTRLHTAHQCFKSWTNWAKKFCLICHVHLTSHQVREVGKRCLQASRQLFAGKNASITSRMQKNAFQEFAKSWNTHFYATRINKHFSLAKMCWL